VSPQRLRVIQWGTGNAGRHALRAIIGRPDLALVGVHAHAPHKVGRDAAELCGLDEPTGVTATADIDDLLASNADCVSYMAQGETRIRDTIDDLTRILAAGKNVVNTALVFLVYPPSIPAGLRATLEAACADGGSSLFTSGLDPGWSGDVLPLALAGACETVDSIRVTEMMDYSTYEDPGFTGVFFGYGRPVDDDAPLFAPGAIAGGWGGMVHLVADALGWTVEELREEHERLPAPETFETAMGTIGAGTCAGVRFELQGLVGGRPVVVAAHVNRLRADIGPD
jgi:4-hydroxy-tetrahydrodipicolinate reductase